MNRTKKRYLAGLVYTALEKYWHITIIVIGLMLASSVPAVQPTGGDFELVKGTIDGGGGASAGGDFVLTGTAGQHDAGTQTAFGDEYALAGGFWAQIGNFVMDLIFDDGFE